MFPTTATFGSLNRARLGCLAKLAYERTTTTATLVFGLKLQIYTIRMAANIVEGNDLILDLYDDDILND